MKLVSQRDVCYLHVYYSANHKPRFETTSHIHQQRMDKENTVCTHNQILFSLIKKGNSITCDNIDKPEMREVTKGQILHDSTNLSHAK